MFAVGENGGREGMYEGLKREVSRRLNIETLMTLMIIKKKNRRKKDRNAALT